MNDAPPRCEGCGNYVDEEDLFCGNCGREAALVESAARNEIEEDFIGFDCETCGASLTYDAAAEGLRCSFCGSVSLKRQSRATGRIKAESYLPFEVPEEAALRAFERWISKGFFRPAGIAREARVVSVKPVYLPFWRFRAKTHTYFTGDSSKTPPFARADWCPVFGERRGTVEDVLVLASGSLAPGELDDISPFDFSRGKPYTREDLRSHAVEDFGLSRRGARDRARLQMLEIERSHAAGEIPGRSRNVHVNTVFSDFRSDPVLVPVWINAYRYREETFRFLVNGQSGKVTGRAPFSWLKLALVVGAVLAAGLVIAALAAAMA